jgi:hypothetical protein
MAKTISIEVRKRGFFGKLFKWSFILFNLLMAFWLFSYWGSVGELMSNQTSDAARTGGAIGATLGTSFIAFFWVTGAVILGLFTLLSRGKKVITTEVVG